MLSFLVLCEWGEWTKGECSQSCGGGVREIARNKTVEEVLTMCEGKASYNEDCNQQPCPGNINVNIEFTTYLL